MSEIRIVNSITDVGWRRFIAENPHANIFHTPEMFQVFSHTIGYRPALWAAINSDQQPLALLLPVQVSVMKGLLRYFATRSIAYGSVLCDPTNEGKDALGFLLKAYTKEIGMTPLFTELRNIHALKEFQPILADNGFLFHDHLNYLINLQKPTDEIWKQMDTQARSKIRRAIRKGVVLEEVASQDKLLLSYAILEKVFKRIQVPLAPSSLFESAFDILYLKNMLNILLAQVEGVYCGVSINLLYKDVVYNWYAGTNGEYASYGINEILNWSIIEWGAKNGFNYFDFGGAGDPNVNYGPRNFKAKFGGELVNYGRNSFVHSPTRLKMSKLGYKLLRRRL